MYPALQIVFLLQSYWAAQNLDFMVRWNDFATQWNATAPKIERGEYPLRDFAELERRFERLRASAMWPKTPAKK